MLTLTTPSAYVATATPGRAESVEQGTVFEWSELLRMFNWQATHVGRAHRDKLKIRLVREQGACAYCGRAMRKPKQGTLDHFRPKSRGGAINCDGNLRLCCRTCQKAKDAKTPEEWLAVLELMVATVRFEILTEGGAE